MGAKDLFSAQDLGLSAQCSTTPEKVSLKGPLRAPRRFRRTGSRAADDDGVSPAVAVDRLAEERMRTVGGLATIRLPR